MKLNCVSCGHHIQLDDAYDNYEGAVRCWVCGSMLDIRVEDGSIRSVKRMLDNSVRTARRSPARIAADDEARMPPVPKNNSDPRPLDTPNLAA